MLVRNDLRILNLYLDDDSISSILNNKIELFTAVEKDSSRINRCYNNWSNYFTQYSYEDTSLLDVKQKEDRKLALWRNIHNGLGNMPVFKYVNNDFIYDITSILWDIIPKSDYSIFSLLAGHIYEDARSDPERKALGLKPIDTDDNKTIYSPKISSEGKVDCDSCLRISEEMRKAIHFLIHTIVIEKLVNRLYYRIPWLEACTKGKRNTRNMVGNFPQIYYKLEAERKPVFSTVLASAILPKDPSSFSLFSTKSMEGGSYKGLGFAINNTVAIYKTYEGKWEGFLKCIDGHIAEKFRGANVKDIVFESYARLNLIKQLDDKRFNSFSIYCENNKSFGYNQLYKQILLLLIFELPVPLNQLYLTIFLSDEGILFRDGRVASMEECEEIIDYLHLLIFNLIPALESQIEALIDTIDEIELADLLGKTLDDLSIDIGSNLIKQNIDKEKQKFDEFENLMNSRLGDRYSKNNDEIYNSNSFFVDIVQRKTLKSVLFNIGSRKYLKYLDHSLSRYDSIRLEIKNNELNNRIPDQYLFLQPLCEELFETIKKIDDIKLAYRTNQADYDITKRNGKELSERENYKLNTLNDCKKLLQDSKIDDLVWQFVFRFYRADTMKLGKQLVSISEEVVKFIKQWLNSESLDEGKYECKRKEKIQKAVKGDIRWDKSIIAHLSQKYYISSDDTKKIIDMIELLDERFNISIRENLSEREKLVQYSYQLSQYFCFLIDCLYHGHNRVSRQLEELPNYYWDYQNHYTCKNL